MYNNSVYKLTEINFFYVIYGFNPSIYIRVEGDADREKVPAVKKRVKYIKKTKKALEKRWQNVNKKRLIYYNKYYKL